ncbi:MAG TPA: ferrochelatase [Candidatus Dormibacteraeota bacterium]|nr:ferrochelatase [Candidatus Dormibacteraeota bacterium]
MAYGSPDGEAGIEPYFTHIRGGRPPSPQALEHLRARYRAVGGSPLTAITLEQGDALSEELGIPVFVGMKHAPPFIADAVAEAKAHGMYRLVGLPLAPHYSEMSVGGYLTAIRAVWPGEVVFVRGFHDHPAFIAAVRGLLEEARRDFDPDLVIFSAHSLPERIEREGDPYRERLLESSRLAAEAASVGRWEFAFQSASATGEPWLGPPLEDTLRGTEARRVLVCPIGFVADHLEILYDIDVEAMALARERGIELRRTASFNTKPEFIRALAAIVRDQLLKA